MCIKVFINSEEAIKQILIRRDIQLSLNKEQEI